MVKHGSDNEDEKIEEDLIEAVPTPKMDIPFTHLFSRNRWWRKYSTMDVLVYVR